MKFAFFVPLFALTLTQPLFAAQETSPTSPDVTPPDITSPGTTSLDTPPPSAPPRIEVPAPPEAETFPPLTADEAVQIALARQPSIEIARADLQAAQGRVRQVRSSFFPQLGVGAGYSRSEQITGANRVSTGNGNGGGSTLSSAGLQTSANVSQLVFDFNYTRSLVRQASAQERALRANLTRVQADLVLQVKQAFYTYVQNERLVQVNEANLSARQEQLRAAQGREASGLGLPSDVVRAQTAVSEAILNLTLVRNSASNSRVILALTLGVDPRTPIEVAQSEETEIAAPDLLALTDTALRQRPEIEQTRNQLEAARRGVDAAKASNAPSVSLNLGIGARGDDFALDNSSFSVGAQISWNPFDGGLTAGRVQEARATLRAAEADLQQTQLLITSEITQAYVDLNSAQQRVTAAASQVADAQETVRLAQGRYEAGVGTFLEVTDAQATLLTAQVNQVNASSALSQARAALRRALGEGLNLPTAPTVAPSEATASAKTKAPKSEPKS